MLVDDPQVSRRHLALEPRSGGLFVIDLGSANGTILNGNRITEARLQTGDQVVLGESRLRFGGPEPTGEAEAARPEPVRSAPSTVALTAPGSAPPAPPAPPGVLAPPEGGAVRSTIALHPREAIYEQVEPGPAGGGDLTAELLAECTWTDELVNQAGIPIVDCPLVTVGGGLGSFALVDFLRIAGVPAGQIRVLSLLEWPHQTYQYLAEASQIRGDDRLRSDSMSRIDNIWGFPSYALEEAMRGRTLAPLWRVLTEPVLSEYYNPKAADMYSGVEREARRIGWPSMLVAGQVRVVRPRSGGGYFVVLTPPPGDGPTKRIAYRARFVHVAVGYPSLRFLPDLQQYRATYNDFYRVVNAYEQHGHVYEALDRSPGTVVVRGAGIVASRILERLAEGRERGSQTQVIHLLRRKVDGPTGGPFFRRPGGDGFAYQPFTYAKAAGSGQLRQRALRLEGQERADYLRSIGGTTTSKRKLWQDQLAKGRAEGWYRLQIGEVQEVGPAPDGQSVLTKVKTGDGSTVDIDADFIIDATGLEGDIRDHRLLSDLLDCAGAGTNASGRIDVDQHFEVRGTQSGDGRLFASGSVAAGGYLPPADSFWGVEHAALEICDELARLGFCRHVGTVRSIRQWWRWMRGVPI